MGLLKVNQAGQAVAKLKAIRFQYVNFYKFNSV